MDQLTFSASERERDTHIPVCVGAVIVKIDAE